MCQLQKVAITLLEDKDFRKPIIEKSASPKYNEIFVKSICKKKHVGNFSSHSAELVAKNIL